MIIFDQKLVGMNHTAIMEESFGVSCSWRFHEKTTWRGKKTYDWRTFLTFGGGGITLPGKCLVEFAQCLDRPNAGIVSLSENFLLFSNFPIAVEYVTISGKNLRIGVVNHRPRLDVDYPHRHDAQLACKEIFNSEMRLVYPQTSLTNTESIIFE